MARSKRNPASIALQLGQANNLHTMHSNVCSASFVVTLDDADGNSHKKIDAAGDRDGTPKTAHCTRARATAVLESALPLRCPVICSVAVPLCTRQLTASGGRAAVTRQEESDLQYPLESRSECMRRRSGIRILAAF